MYSPKEYQEWQKVVLKALHSVEAVRFEGPVEVEVACFVTKPKTSKLPHPKPDVDNYAKGVLDVITKDGRFWTDDCQVQSLTVRKGWIEGSGYIAVTIKDL